MSSFQASAGEQGRRFEEAVEVLALVEGFVVKERHWRHPVVAVEIDLVLERPGLGEVWVECKGSWRSTSDRNGLQRTDTLKKAIGSAAILRSLPPEDRRPYWLVVSHLPREGSAGATWLRILEDHFDRVLVVGMAPEEPHND